MNKTTKLNRTKQNIITKIQQQIQNRKEKNRIKQRIKQTINN